jgi:hypothetical protein
LNLVHSLEQLLLSRLIGESGVDEGGERLEGDVGAPVASPEVKAFVCNQKRPVKDCLATNSGEDCLKFSFREINIL